MPSAYLIAAVALCGCVLFVLLLIGRARPGREDKKGFHREPDKEACNDLKNIQAPVPNDTANAIPCKPAASKK